MHGKMQWIKRFSSHDLIENHSVHPHFVLERRLNPENGILPQSLAAAAMVAGGVKLPDVSDSKTHTGLAWMYSDAWELGFTAVYQVCTLSLRVDVQRCLGARLF